MDIFVNIITLTDEKVPGAKLPNEPEKCSVMQLERWLECRGRKKTGKKFNLVERVRTCMLLNMPIDLKVDGGLWYDKKAKRKPTIEEILNEEYIDCIAEEQPSNLLLGSGWKTFPSRDLPEMFHYGHVYAYLIESLVTVKLNEGEQGNADDGTGKPLRKGRSLLSSNFVENVTDNADEHHYYASAHVHHSMKNEKPLHVIITISKASGGIMKGKCTCRVHSLERCCHIAAVLLMLSDFVATNGCRVIKPSTSLPCVWNKGQKRKKDPKALHLATYSSSKKKNEVYNFDPRNPEYRKHTTQLANEFISSLRSVSNKKTMWEDIITYKYNDFTLTSDDLNIITALVVEFESNIGKLTREICGAESTGQVPGTELQADSNKWHTTRWQRITTSTCKVVLSYGKRICKSEPLNCQNFLWQKLWSTDNVSSADMLYGIMEEPAARKRYSETTGKIAMISGIWINKTHPHLGGGPDGLLLDSDNK